MKLISNMEPSNVSFGRLIPSIVGTRKSDAAAAAGTPPMLAF